MQASDSPRPLPSTRTLRALVTLTAFTALAGACNPTAVTGPTPGKSARPGGADGGPARGSAAPGGAASSTPLSPATSGPAIIPSGLPVGLASGLAGGLASSAPNGLTGGIGGHGGGVIGEHGAGLIGDAGSEIVSNNGGSLAGVVLAPNADALQATADSGLISGNTGNLISKVRTYALAAATAAPSAALEPAKQVTVEIVDETGKSLAPAVTTDDQGRFTIPQIAPSGKLVFVTCTYEANDVQATLSLAVAAPRGAEGATALRVDPTSSLVAKKLSIALADDKTRSGLLTFDALAALSASISATIKDDLASAALLYNGRQAAQLFDGVTAGLLPAEGKPAGSEKLLVATQGTAPMPAVSPGPGTITTFAGTGEWGYQDGPAATAKFANPQGLTFDAAGNMYVTDRDNHRVRKIDPQGNVSTLAGSGEMGLRDGAGALARFGRMGQLAASPGGPLYVVEGPGDVRAIEPDGKVTTLAGSAMRGSADGQGAAARFFQPLGIALAGDGNLYVTDFFNNTVRKVTPSGAVTTLVGDADKKGEPEADGVGKAARLVRPAGIAYDAKRNRLVVGQSLSRSLRFVGLDGTVSTFAADAAASEKLGSPSRVTVSAAGNIYAVDLVSRRITRIGEGNDVSVVAEAAKQGDPFQTGAVDGPIGQARLASPAGLAFGPDGALYVADTYYHRIRRIVLPAGLTP